MQIVDGFKNLSKDLKFEFRRFLLHLSAQEKFFQSLTVAILHLNVENFDAFRRLLSDHEGVFEVFALFGREPCKVALLVGENELLVLFFILLVDRLLHRVRIFTFLLAGLGIRRQTENIIRHGP